MLIFDALIIQLISMTKKGGKREGAGRKPKAAEIKLIEQMDAYIAPGVFWENLAVLVMDKDLQAMKLWANYRFGMPNQKIEHSGDAFEQVTINLIEKKND